MKENNNSRKFVFICAHPDDDILVGGTMNKLANVGWDVYEIVCSTGKFAFPEGNDGKNIMENRINETKRYCGLLGAHEPIILNPNTRLFGENEEIILQVAKTLRDIKPDVIVLLNRDDYHFEHKVAHDIGARAFEIACRKTQPELGERIKKGILLQTDGLNVLPNPLIVFNTSKTHENKVHAEQDAYKERVDQYLIDFGNGLAQMRGARVGYKYAEAYDLLNPTWYKFTAENSQILAEFVNTGNGDDWKSRS